MRIIVSFTATIHKKSPQISSYVVLFDYWWCFRPFHQGKTSPDFAICDKISQNMQNHLELQDISNIERDEQRPAQDDKEEDEREDDTDGGQGADERGLVYEAVGREGRGEEKKGWGEAKAKNAQAAATTTPIRCRRTRPRPAPDPELDPEPETVGGHSAGAPLLRRSARLVAWVLLLRLWAKTGVAVSVPAAVRENFRCISGRGCTVLSTMGLLEREGDLPPVQRKSMTHLAGAGHRGGHRSVRACVEKFSQVLNAHLGGQYLMKYSFLPSVAQLHLIERRSYSMADKCPTFLTNPWTVQHGLDGPATSDWDRHVGFQLSLDMHTLSRMQGKQNNGSTQR
ncbi:hypothetical protein B0H14DRAFT_2614446 [Mycena olivaceomarginata]|nr:hypothetical protein B0H14DRAFT_2614446 [Mycena olivaceomarginata]